MHVILFGVLAAAAAGGSGGISCGDEVRDILRRLDERIYVPEGIVALSFTYAPGSKASAAGNVRVRHSWREGVGDRTELLDAEGRAFDRTTRKPTSDPAAEREEDLRLLRSLGIAFVPEDPAKADEEIRKHLRTTSRELRQVVLGQTFLRQYGDWRGEVVRKIKNGEEHVSLVLEPSNPKRVRRVVIDLGRDGLPWRSEKELMNRDRIEMHLSFEPRDSKVVLSKVQHLYTPGTPGEPGVAYAYSFTWQKVDGRLLLATVRKEGRDIPPEFAGTTEFASMLVNDAVPVFEPDK